MVVALLVAGQFPPSTPMLGIKEGRCRIGESGPAFDVEVEGLKDRRGHLKLELYPADDADFLADDNVLIAAGKPFARVETPEIPPDPVRLCIRAPSPGSYALSLLHDRNGDRRFNVSGDGIGFSGNPRLGWSKPSARLVRVVATTGRTSVRIRVNYRNGLFSFGPAAR